MEKLTKDPRYEAGISLRKEGQYEDAIEFFSELLKSFDDETQSQAFELWTSLVKAFASNTQMRNDLVYPVP
mgnify:CR=1 FL=1